MFPPNSELSVTSSCVSCGSCGVVWSHKLELFQFFSIENRVLAGVSTPPDSGKTPQLKTSKLAHPFTNKFDNVSPGRLRQVAQLCAGSLALPVFRLSGPGAVPSWGRHCYEQLTLLPGFDDRAMTCPWIPVASYALYTHAFFSVQRHMALARSLSKPASQLHIWKLSELIQWQHHRIDFFFRPTPYGSRQVVKQAGKPVAYLQIQ